MDYIAGDRQSHFEKYHSYLFILQGLIIIYTYLNEVMYTISRDAFGVKLKFKKSIQSTVVLLPPARSQPAFTGSG